MFCVLPRTSGCFCSTTDDNSPFPRSWSAQRESNDRGDEPSGCARDVRRFGWVAHDCEHDRYEDRHIRAAGGTSWPSGREADHEGGASERLQEIYR